MNKAMAPAEDAPAPVAEATDTGKGTEGDPLTGPPAPEPAQAAPEAKPTAAELARKGLVCLGQLGKDTLARMQQQALAPTWKLDSAGRRLVEPKEETKKKLRRSPDDMDALNLCYYPASHNTTPAPLPAPPRRSIRPDRAEEPGRQLFGRGD